MILGLDSSLTAFGYAVLGNEGQLFEMGSWKTKPQKTKTKTADHARRFAFLGTELLRLIDRCEPVLFAGIEGLAYVRGTGVLASSAMGRVRGMADGILLAKGIETWELQPQHLRYRITGERKSEKSDVERIMRVRHPGAEGDDNAFDALAVATLGYEDLRAAGRIPSFECEFECEF